VYVELTLLEIEAEKKRKQYLASGMELPAWPKNFLKDTAESDDQVKRGGSLKRKRPEGQMRGKICHRKANPITKKRKSPFQPC